jgi:hypothetical protein
MEALYRSEQKATSRYEVGSGSREPDTTRRSRQGRSATPPMMLHPQPAALSLIPLSSLRTMPHWPGPRNDGNRRPGDTGQPRHGGGGCGIRSPTVTRKFNLRATRASRSTRRDWLVAAVPVRVKHTQQLTGTKPMQLPGLLPDLVGLRNRHKRRARHSIIVGVTLAAAYLRSSHPGEEAAEAARAVGACPICGTRVLTHRGRHSAYRHPHGGGGGSDTHGRGHRLAETGHAALRHVPPRVPFTARRRRRWQTILVGSGRRSGRRAPPQTGSSDSHCAATRRCIHPYRSQGRSNRCRRRGRGRVRQKQLGQRDPGGSHSSPGPISRRRERVTEGASPVILVVLRSRCRTGAVRIGLCSHRRCTIELRTRESVQTDSVAESMRPASWPTPVRRRGPGSSGNDRHSTRVMTFLLRL